MRSIEEIIQELGQAVMTLSDSFIVISKWLIEVNPDEMNKEAKVFGAHSDKVNSLMEELIGEHRDEMLKHRETLRPILKSVELMAEASQVILKIFE